MINFNPIAQFFSGITKAIGHVAKAFTGILNSPLGGLLKAAFPAQAAAAVGLLGILGMFGDLSKMIGGQATY